MIEAAIGFLLRFLRQYIPSDSIFSLSPKTVYSPVAELGSAEAGNVASGLRLLSGEGLLDQGADARVDVVTTDKEGDVGALDVELQRVRRVTPGDFYAHFFCGAAVTADGDSGGLSFLAELGELIGCDVVVSLLRTLSH